MLNSILSRNTGLGQPMINVIVGNGMDLLYHTVAMSSKELP